jgi:transcriptional regulator with XRE-family HTH domain
MLTDADIRRTWGTRIAAARTAAGLNRGEVSRAFLDAGLRVSPQAVAQWESGATSPRPGLRLALADILGADANELYSLDDIEAVA